MGTDSMDGFGLCARAAGVRGGVTWVMRSSESYERFGLYFLMVGGGSSESRSNGGGERNLPVYL